MTRTNNDTHRQHYMATIIGGAIGAFIAIALGVPLGALLLLAVAATAYACRWRILIVRKPPESDSPCMR